MSPAERTPFALGDRLTLRKKHPCGGREWDVYRVGMDIGLKCATCGRHVMLSRRITELRTISRTPAQAAQEVKEAQSGGV